MPVLTTPQNIYRATARTAPPAEWVVFAGRLAFICDGVQQGTTKKKVLYPVKTSILS